MNILSGGTTDSLLPQKINKDTVRESKLNTRSDLHSLRHLLNGTKTVKPESIITIDTVSFTGPKQSKIDEQRELLKIKRLTNQRNLKQ